MPRAESSSSKALQAILPLVAAGQPYEAHQKARTFASRYQKAGQYDTAIDVLFQSSRELLKVGQKGSGTDLTLFLLDVYENKPETVNDESRGRVTQLIALIGPEQSWRKSVIDKAISWSAKRGVQPGGDSSLHHYIGGLLHKDNAFDAAEYHLLNSGTRDSARLLAQVYYDWAHATNSVSSHAESFVLKGLLPYLLNGDILAARTFVSAFLALLPLDQTPFRSAVTSQEQALIEFNVKETSGSSSTDAVTVTGLPVLNFAQLAVRIIQRADQQRAKVAREAWIRLCGTYQSRGGLLASREVRSTLSELGSLYFALPTGRAQNANPFGDMLSGLFGGGAGGGAPQVRRIIPNSGLSLD